MRRLVLCALLGASSLGSAPAGSQEPQIRTFPAKEGSSVVVSVNSSEIRVTVWQTSEVQVLIVGGEPRQFQIAQSGSTITVQDDRRWGWGDARLEIRVPSKTDLDLQTRSGEIEVRGDVVGSVTARTSAGDIMLGGIEGRVYAATSGGDVSIGRLTGDGELKTSGGDIDSRDTDGNLDVKTSGGRIRLGNVTGMLQANTSGGDIDVGEVGQDADLNTSGGDVSVRAVGGHASLRTSGGDIELSGNAGPTDARTSGGDIELRRIQAPSEVRTAGGDIEVGLVVEGQPAGVSRLITRGGEIVLTLAPDTRASIEALIRIQGNWRGRQDEYKIRSDFEAVSIEQDPKGKEIKGRLELNGGGHRIVLETSNGDITIRRGR